jgi:hypothetical protein
MSEEANRVAGASAPDLMVEKLALGELAGEQAAALRRRLDEAGDERLAAIERSNAEILREHPPAEVAAAVRRRLARLEDETPARARPSWLMWAPMAAAAAVALMWWVGGNDPETGIRGGEADPVVIAKAEPPVVADDGATPEQIFIKGDPVLMIDRVQDGRPQRMADAARVAAGDLLQVGYNAKGAQQGVVVSIDGAGVATLHFPAAEADDPRLDHGGPIPLSASYELDDAPGFERFFFVTVDTREPRLDVAGVMEAARMLARGADARDGELALPQGWRQQSILLRK